MGGGKKNASLSFTAQKEHQGLLHNLRPRKHKAKKGWSVAALERFFFFTKFNLDLISWRIVFFWLGRCLHFVAHPVDLLDVGEDHLGVDPAVPHHGVHVVGGKEVRDASIAPNQLIISAN